MVHDGHGLPVGLPAALQPAQPSFTSQPQPTYPYTPQQQQQQHPAQGWPYSNAPQPAGHDPHLSAQLTPQSYRRMTPVERKETRMQNIITSHAEQLRRLAFERQQIVAAQGLYLGSMEPIQQQHTDAQTRSTARQVLVQQLAQELAGAEAMLESLKQGDSFAAARKAGLRVHAEMEEIRTEGPRPQANTAAHQHTQRHAVLATGGSRAAASTPTPARFVTDALQSSLRTSVHKPLHPIGQQPGLSLLWHEPLTYSSTPAATSQAITDSDFHANTAARSDPDDVLPDASEWSRPGSQHPNMGKSRRMGTDVLASRGNRAGVHTEAEAPAYIQELRQQVEALRGIMEAQLKQQQVQPQQPIIMPVPWNIPSSQPPQRAAAAPDGLPPEVADLDPSMRALHARHMRELTLLRWEIDRARTAAELEQLRSTVANMQQRTQAPGRAGSTTSLPDAGRPPPRPSLDGPPLPASPGPQSVLMMDVPPQKQPQQFITQQEDVDSEEGSEFTEDDDTLADRPTPLAVGSTVRADVLHIHVMSIGPCTVRGSYRLRVVLYDGFQPLYVGPGLVVGASTTRRPLTSNNGAQVVLFNETLTLRGLSLSATMMIVFELYLAKQAIAGMPSREDLAAWAYCNAVAQGQVVSGRQSVPMYRLPIMMSAQRHFTYNNAMLDFTVTQREGEQGVLGDATAAVSQQGTTAGRASPGPASAGALPASPGAISNMPEDMPGVPSAAWLKVARGTPPSDPFTPGDGFVVIVDAARFLPANVTVSKVSLVVLSPDRKTLTPTCQALSQPDSDAYNPRYGSHFTLGQGVDQFDNAAATLLLTVYTRERWSGGYRVVGYTAVHVFIDPRTQEQPLSKNVKDYVLNAGAFQLPLHIGLSTAAGPFRTGSLQQQVPRVSCASLLVRILTPDMAKRQRRNPAPDYTERVYDSMRAVPTPVERPLFSKYLARKPLLVREAARLLASIKQGAASAAAALPGTDPELLDWIEERLVPDDASPPAPISYNMASEYYKDLGFYVSVDGALRLPRNLPAGALISFAPPGSFYQDNPVVDDMKVTLEWDMTSCLAAPRWTDGWQHFNDVVYEPGLVVLIDIRLLVPSAGSSMPAGWTVLPVFEKTTSGQFVASGCYQLPLFQGVPSRHIIQELANKGDVDTVISQQLKSGRIKAHEDCCSVMVRLVDASRQSQLEAAPWSTGPAADGQPPHKLRMPGYMNDLGPRFLATMRQYEPNKTYNMAKPDQVTDTAWRDMMASCLCKAAGLNVTGNSKDLEASTDEDTDSVV